MLPIAIGIGSETFRVGVGGGRGSCSDLFMSDYRRDTVSLWLLIFLTARAA